MSRDEIWQAIDAQRLALAAILDDLSADEWQVPSLCAGWTVRDVAAHLTLQQLGLRDLGAMMLSWRGSMDRTIAHAARRKARMPTGQLVAELRGMAGSRRHTLGVTYLETLTDILVHGQDIAVPLGRELVMPPAAAAVAATRMLTMRIPPPLPAARRAKGVRLAATDVDWSFGTGPEVSGPMEALLLAVTGRGVALPRLAGHGVPRLGL
ncbi:uncharacterized protein (TIGR03083 family) [Actinoplanes tereljensis]|uniref:Mycothiol-dependent maleylpyruvate isomerase metal-binding domain-containing protein n=1 Tax=Paractinoplanes tereljensis TaxID=571912 RepID=A0A919NLN5_9ACTN|nr:maleylpyruvate isomerase family mycothiol-dependent enzyme [Actinoplanes tereljensis]GIF20415.1 hypothetical protein Ate02nite_31450 [Actinoplanes tereljensis]